MINGTEYFLHESNRYGKMQKDSITLLPPYDELLIGYKDRSAVLSKGARKESLQYVRHFLSGGSA